MSLFLLIAFGLNGKIPVALKPIISKNHEIFKLSNQNWNKDKLVDWFNLI